MSTPKPNLDPTSGDAELFGLPEATHKGPGAARDPIEWLATEYLDAVRRGETPQIEDYAATYPDQADQIRELFPLIAALEDWKSDREQVVIRGPMPEKFDVEQLGDCRILRELGRGGMGVVFEAEQAPIGRRVAVKLLPWKMGAKSRWRERFQQEARTVAMLKHPHIVPVFRSGEQDGMCYYVMQLVEGVGINRLIDRLRQGAGVVTTQDIAMDFAGKAGAKSHPELLASTAAGVLRRDAWKPIVRIAYQALDAIRYAHKQRMLHRDIKPANLMIDVRGFVWVADFGLAVAQEDVQGGAGFAGTLRYMSPEQLQGQVDERSDLYAFGLTLYEMCVLKPAFEAQERQELMDKIMQGRVLRPRKVNRDVPKSIEQIILTAIDPQPEQRYQTADEFLAELREFLETKGWHPFRNLFRRRKR
ncbi:MAG: serine/threonine-protein kinase [Planctomycetaceae bacterium]